MTDYCCTVRNSLSTTATFISPSARHSILCSSANARPATQGDVIKLYYALGACSLSRHIALLEAGLKATLVKVDSKTHKTADGADFYAINAKG